MRASRSPAHLSSLGKTYAEPAADVRGYIAYVKSQKK
jgi:hypothetical protein